MAVQHDRDIVVVTAGGGQFVEHRVGDRVDGHFHRLRHHLGDTSDPASIGSSRRSTRPSV
jgi:hypothetical protein